MSGYLQRSETPPRMVGAASFPIVLAIIMQKILEKFHFSLGRLAIFIILLVIGLIIISVGIFIFTMLTGAALGGFTFNYGIGWVIVIPIFLIMAIILLVFFGLPMIISSILSFPLNLIGGILNLPSTSAGAKIIFSIQVIIGIILVILWWYFLAGMIMKFIANRRK